MVRTRVLVVIGLLTSALACSRDRGARVRPLPQRSQSHALRGGGPARSPRIANYAIDARLDAARHQITATETLRWTNPGTSAVDSLPFHLYLNAFKNETTEFMRSSHGVMRGVAATDTGWGWIDVESIKVGGVERVQAIRAVGSDATVVELPLAQPVGPGATIEVELRFTAQLPEVWARTGYQGEFHMVGQWFPKIGVRIGAPGAERWECQPFHVNTEFFADFGNYDVAITVPNTYVVAATGVLVQAAESPGGTRTLSYHAEDVHDFAWMADPFMDVMTGQAKLVDGTVDVRVYYRPEHKDFARRHLDAAVRATEQFSAMFQPYPWSVLSIVDPPIDARGAAGQEYPTLVTTGGDSVFARPGLRLPEYVTVHEVGHSWFQGMLASNEPIEPWLDEGLDEWADAKVMTALYGARSSAIDWMGWQAEIARLRQAVTDDPASLPSPIATAAFAFVDPEAYADAAYVGTLRALRTLEQTVGANRFAAAMKAYVATWAFKHPTGRDLFATLTSELHEDLTWFVEPAFEHVGRVQLGIRSASCTLAHPPRGVFGEGSGKTLHAELDAADTGSYVCEVVVTSTGTVHVPVDLQLKFADGSVLDQTWDDRNGATWERFVFERSSALVEVWLDPSDKIALDSPVTHHFRLAGDGSASLRAAAWINGATQTLMQLVGP